MTAFPVPSLPDPPIGAGPAAWFAAYGFCAALVILVVTLVASRANRRSLIRWGVLLIVAGLAATYVARARGAGSEAFYGWTRLTSGTGAWLIVLATAVRVVRWARERLGRWLDRRSRRRPAPRGRGRWPPVVPP